MFKSLEKIRSLAIVGATGLVGRETVAILNESKHRIPKVRLFASERSAGEAMELYGEEQVVEVLTEKSFEGIEVAFFTVPSEATAKYVPLALKAGCLVVDDSSAFRMQPEVPLIVPEINGQQLKNFKGKLISNPNCSTIPVVMALKPLADKYGLKRVVVSTYQSVSGAGTRAFEELKNQTTQLLSGNTPEPEVFPHRIAFNVLPQIGAVDSEWNAGEEKKIIQETRKILGLPQLKVAAHTVRVPTFYGHGATVSVELESNFASIDEIRELMDDFPGVKVIDRPENQIYPTNADAAGSDDVFVGRIRRDSSVPYGINLWCILDNLRKGAALNVLQILDCLYENHSP